MKTYVLKRILLFFPTLLIITLLAFAISVNAPGDPVERMVIASHDGNDQANANSNLNQQKKYWRNKLGLNLPVFYVQLSDWASPDTLYKIEDSNEKDALGRLLSNCGNWQSVAAYSHSIAGLANQLSVLKLDSSVSKNYKADEINRAIWECKSATNALRTSYDARNIAFQFQLLEANFSFLKVTESLGPIFNLVKHTYNEIQENKSTWKLYVPCLHFYPNNQYHRWLFGDGNWINGIGSTYSRGLIRGDFGTSYGSKEAVSKKIWSRLGVSLFFSLLSVFFAYLISIPIAAKAASKPHSRFDSVSTLLLFSLYSLPSFFLATLLLMAFANPDVLHLFPASGWQPASGIPDNTGFLERCYIHLPYVILPLICYTYSSFAFLSRTMRSALLENMSLDYIRTARAKGLSEEQVVYKHAFKNALFPVITLFATIFPYAIGGSVILETIFTLPGMGLETYTAIQNQDYPVIIAVFTLTGCLTLIGTLLADILYAFVDPRISFSKKA